MSFTIATTIEEALDAIAAGARPIAGGSDLVVGARQGTAPLPDALVSIDRIVELRSIDVADGLRIGACVTHRELMTAEPIVDTYSGLADACALIGSPATRNVGTVGGNVMNGSPAMDTGAPLLVFGGSVELASVSGTRNVDLADLWTGPRQTSARPDELCVAIHAPDAPSGSAYVRLEYRRAMEIAVVGAAAAITLTDDGAIASARVALTSVGPTILEVSGLTDRSPETAGTQVAAFASEQATPISDLRGSDKYRRHTVGVIARRAFEAAVGRAWGENIPVPVNRSTGIGAS